MGEFMQKIVTFIFFVSMICFGAINCKDSKKDPMFLLLGLLGQSDGVGGNEGMAAPGAASDPIPPVTAEGSGGGSSEVCAPVVPAPVPSAADILAQQPLTGDGTTTSQDMFVERGVLVGNLSCGKLTKNDGTEAQVVKNGAINGSFVVKDINGNTVSGTTMIIADDFLFIPAAAFQMNKVYTITFTITGGGTFTENIFMAIDNTCAANSLFEQATVFGSTTTTNLSSNVIADNNGLNKSIMGWDFSQGRFYMTLGNKTAGAKYILTLYGVYDIQYHNCEVYYQRFATTPFNTVENIDITNSGRMHVDETDSSLPNGSGGYYDFSKTYIQIKVYDANNNDITTTDTATMLLEYTPDRVAMNQTQQGVSALASAEKFVPESGLAAFLGASRMNWIILIAIAILGIAGSTMIVLMRKRQQKNS